MTITDIKLHGISRADYQGYEPDFCYLCYRLVDNETKVARVTITTNPWLIMAKQQKGEKFYFVKVRNIDAFHLANVEIAYYRTGQHLFNVLTLRQALKRFRKYDKNYSREMLQQLLDTYNKDNGTKECIITYGTRTYIPRNIVEDMVSYMDFNKWRNER